jgi:hypothetical protein
MKKFFQVFSIIFLLAVSFGNSPAIQFSDIQDLLIITPQDLANELVGAVNVVPGSVIFPNIGLDAAREAAGTFRNGLVDGLGIERGVMLTTGDVLNALGPNLDPALGEPIIQLGDLDLDLLVAPAITQDAVVLEFDFIPTRNSITFKFVFASDEYSESVGDLTGLGNDVFALFINGVNVALVPATVNPITVNTLNGTVTPALFINNDPIPPNPAPFLTQYDGFSRVLTATAPVNIGVANHIKLAIADTGPAPGDQFVDSAVFIAQAVTFEDVQPNNLGFNEVEAIAGAGITVGCQADNPLTPQNEALFCPQGFVTREQMSAFIIRALEGEPTATTITVPMSGDQEVPLVITQATGTASLTVNLTTGALSGTINFSNLSTGGITAAHIHEGAAGTNGPPIVPFTGFTPGQTAGTVTISGTLTAPQIAQLIAGNLYFNIHSVSFTDGEIRGQIVPRFTDVPFNQVFFRHIERMAQLNITVGIGGGLFGPGLNVTREQMAAFIIRAVFPGNPPGVCAAPPFPDVPVTNQFCRHIEELKALNITLGFPDGTYRPLDNVTRNQMALFLARAFLGF